MKNDSVKLDPYVEEITEGIADAIAALVGSVTKMDVVLAVARKVNEVQASLEKVMPAKQAATATKDWIQQVVEKQANCTYPNIRKWVQIENWRKEDSRAGEVLGRKDVHIAWRMASFFMEESRVEERESLRVKAAFNLVSEMPMSDRQVEKLFNLYKRDAVLFEWLATHARSYEVLSALLKKSSLKGVIPKDLRKGLLEWNFDGTPLTVVDVERIDRESHAQVIELVQDLKVAIQEIANDDEDDEPVVRANHSCSSCAYGSFSNLPGQSQKAKVGRCNHRSRRGDADLNLFGGVDPGVHCNHWLLTDRLSGKPKKDVSSGIPEETSHRKEQEVHVSATQSNPKAVKPRSQAYFRTACERFTFNSMAGWDAKSKKFSRLELAAICTLYGVAVQENEILKIEIDDLRERIGHHLSEFLPR